MSKLRHKSASPRRSASDRLLAQRLLTLLRHGGDIRRRKVRRIGAKVRMRAYENDLKLAVAAERILEEV